MTIKRFDTTGSIDADGEVFNAAGTSIGRAHLSARLYHRVHDAGTQQNPDAEVTGIPRATANIRFDDGGVFQLTMAAHTQEEMTIRLDGGDIRFRVVSAETGEVRITGVRDHD